MRRDSGDALDASGCNR